MSVIIPLPDLDPAVTASISTTAPATMKDAAESSR